MQTRKIDQLEQEVYELRGEVTTLRAEVEKLTSLLSSLMATKDPPLVQQRPQPLCQPMCTERPRLQALQQPIPQSQASRQPQFDPIPMKYAELLPGSLKKNLVQTRPPPRGPKKLPAGYRPDLSCTFHQGAPGHDIEQCFAFRTVVQKLIEADLIPFEEFGFEYAS